MLPSQRNRSRAAFIGLFLMLLVSFFYGSMRNYIQAVFLLQNTASPNIDSRSPLSSLFLYPISESNCQVPIDAGGLRARLYRPIGAKRPPGIVLAVGIHYQGIDEPRGVALARAIAATGIVVLAVEFPEFLHYRFDPATIKSIASSSRYLARQTNRLSSGVIGISFAGGLALLAAADPVLQKSIGFVAALGAHCDVNRVVQYYAGDTVFDPAGRPYSVPPHPYGARVLIFGYLDKLFSPSDIFGAREALLLYLHDRHKEARIRGNSLSKEGREKITRLLDETDLHSIGRDVLAAAKSNQSVLQAVSPCGKLARLTVPIYLIHGADDPIIPSAETLWLARQVPPQYLRWALVSPVLRHAELGKKYPYRDYWKLISFFADLLAQAHRLPFDSNGHSTNF